MTTTTTTTRRQTANTRALTRPRKPSAAPTLPRAAALALASATISGDLAPLRALAALPGKRGGWSHYATRLLSWLENGMTIPPPFTIFAKGNSKLPFSAFSALPLVSCPGAGTCTSFCYSLTAWRYPAALFRQIQNTLLLQSPQGRAIIAAAFARLPVGPVRLYVDGDFDSVATIRFWMALIATRPNLPVYGYSKSWVELLAAHLGGIAWPSNYLLNLSSGSKHGEGLRQAMAALPITRGEFNAVHIAHEHISNRAYQGPDRPGWSDYRRAVAAASPPRTFVCRGRCGTCLPDGSHACGSERMRGVTIAIGTH